MIGYYLATSNLNNLTIMVELCMVIVSLIIITRINPMISLFNLILFYILIAKYLYLINLSIIGLFYLLIYVGAISVLFIFILTLIDIKASEINSMNKKSNVSILVIFYILLITFLIIWIVYPYIDVSNEMVYNSDDMLILKESEIQIVGELFYIKYSLLFIILAIMLLLAILTAIVLLKWI